MSVLYVLRLANFVFAFLPTNYLRLLDASLHTVALQSLLEVSAAMPKMIQKMFANDLAFIKVINRFSFSCFIINLSLLLFCICLFFSVVDIYSFCTEFHESAER